MRANRGMATNAHVHSHNEVSPGTLHDEQCHSAPEWRRKSAAAYLNTAIGFVASGVDPEIPASEREAPLASRPIDYEVFPIEVLRPLAILDHPEEARWAT